MYAQYFCCVKCGFCYYVWFFIGVILNSWCCLNTTVYILYYTILYYGLVACLAAAGGIDVCRTSVHGKFPNRDDKVCGTVLYGFTSHHSFCVCNNWFFFFFVLNKTTLKSLCRLKNIINTKSAKFSVPPFPTPSEHDATPTYRRYICSHTRRLFCMRGNYYRQARWDGPLETDGSVVVSYHQSAWLIIWAIINPGGFRVMFHGEDNLRRGTPLAAPQQGIYCTVV